MRVATKATKRVASHDQPPATSGVCHSVLLLMVSATVCCHYCNGVMVCSIMLSVYRAQLIAMVK